MQYVKMDETEEKDGKSPLFSWFQRKYFIIMLMIWSTLGILYSVVVYYETTKDPKLPFISTLGFTYPGTFVFGVTLNGTAVFGFVCAYLIHDYWEESNLLKSYALYVTNDVSVVIGFVVCLGTMVVACAPFPILNAIHSYAALILYSSFVIYCGLQCYFSRFQKTRGKLIIRCLFLLTSATALVVCLAFVYSEDQRWISVIAEWVLGACLILFFATFYTDLNREKRTPSSACRREHSIDFVN